MGVQQAVSSCGQAGAGRGRVGGAWDPRGSADHLSLGFRLLALCHVSFGLAAWVLSWAAAAGNQRVGALGW
jgi:hypothetical protein